ncbi:MAG: DegV family protein [Oscillospiraceae bacterium]|nr:DegV family protein [Oscillospiraceae bacterium]
MSNYVIFTDSASDIKPEVLNKWEVPFINLTFRFEGDEKEYSNSEMSADVFYSKMRNGGIAKTSAINPETFSKAFEEILIKGTDILYLGFSSGLSTTFNSAKIAAQELLEKYPERKILCVDTLAASAGQGMLVYLAVEKKNSGASIEETAEYIEGIKLKLCHWFTVDDLVYLKRGGRISPTLAFVGNLLGIKPVLHVDNEGHLVNMFKVRGRKASIAALAEKFGELASDKKNGTVYISNGDCLNDVKLLEETLKNNYGAKVDIVTDVGPVIGAHSGPGTLALFFVGEER